VVKAGAIPGGGQQANAAPGAGGLVNFLQSRGGDLEKEIIRKGMSKA